MSHDHYPRLRFARTPTPLEPMPNLTKLLGGPNLYVKRDDLTGLAFGGNKVRQLEYWFGDIAEKGADTVITTGATQSNHARVTAAMASKLGLKCEVQHEKRVPDRDEAYYESGNVLLLKLMGARLHDYPVGEDEHGADAALEEIAGRVRSEGGKPYVIPLAPVHPPLGALGYVDMIDELLETGAGARPEDRRDRDADRQCIHPRRHPRRPALTGKWHSGVWHLRPARRRGPTRAGSGPCAGGRGPPRPTRISSRRRT